VEPVLRDKLSLDGRGWCRTFVVPKYGSRLVSLVHLNPKSIIFEFCRFNGILESNTSILALLGVL
jgi:hypothetical protein